MGEGKVSDDMFLEGVDPYLMPPVFPPVKREPEFIKKLLGKRIKVLLNNDDELFGVVTGFNRYEIVMKLEETEDADAVTVLLMKHAISIIIPDDEEVFDKKKPETIKTPFLSPETEAGKRMTD
jgi:sRNA-binding regulator protein Hfq